MRSIGLTGWNRDRNASGGRLKARRLLAAGLLAASLTACGSDAADMQSESATVTEDSAAAYDMADTGIYEARTAVYEEESAAEEGAEQITEAAATDRKLIKTVNISAETEDFDSLLSGLEEQITALGGYIEDLSVYNRNNYSAYEEEGRYLRYAGMTARIPADNLDSFLTQVDEQSNIVSRSESVSDVTLQYVDLESHKQALLTEQDRLMELLEEAETVEDIIAIESRLSEVRYEIESMESQLRTYDNKIDYSTVYLSLEEVEHYTPGEDAGVMERIRSGFLESLRGVGTGICDLAVWLVIHLPYLLAWAIVIGAAVFLCRIIRKRRRRKKQAQTTEEERKE